MKTKDFVWLIKLVREHATEDQRTALKNGLYQDRLRHWSQGFLAGYFFVLILMLIAGCARHKTFEYEPCTCTKYEGGDGTLPGWRYSIEGQPFSTCIPCAYAGNLAAARALCADAAAKKGRR
jgi:hypothetical protein